jgi:predicted nucleic acid binding AN1-type Zn finger protein
MLCRFGQTKTNMTRMNTIIDECHPQSNVKTSTYPNNSCDSCNNQCWGIIANEGIA